MVGLSEKYLSLQSNDCHGIQYHIVTTDQDTVFVYEITRALHVMSSVRRRVLEVLDAQ